VEVMVVWWRQWIWWRQCVEGLVLDKWHEDNKVVYVCVYQKYKDILCVLVNARPDGGGRGIIVCA
jgi:hypothetical protein